MAGTQVNPTRMELTRLKKKLVTAVRGHKLLKDKRDELMRQFLDKVRENKALREEVETALVSANQNFMLARAGMPDEMLNTALLAPKQELTISAGTQNVMSVEIPDFDFKTRTPDQNDMYSYGFAFTTGDLDDAILSLSEVFPKMLKLAEEEKSTDAAKARTRAMELLAGQELSSGQLYERLNHRYTQQTSAAVVAEMVQREYINDARYAETRAHALLAAKKSRRAAAQNLRQKGLAAGEIQQALDAVYAPDVSGEDPELEAAAALVEGHYRKKLEAGRRDLVIAALQRRGFSYSVIKEAIRRVEEGE